MVKIDKKMGIIAIIFIVVIILVGLQVRGWLLSPQAKQDENISRIIVADAPTTHHLNLYVAQEKGLFAKHGIKVEIVKSENLAAARDSIVAGAADVFWACPTLAIAAIGGGAPIRTIAQVKIPCTSVLLVPADSGIQNYNDLDGKTIAGISPTCEAVIAISRAAEKAGAKFNLSKMDGGTAVIALKAGQVDGSILEEPHASIAEIAGFRVIFREAAAAIPCRTINARTGFLRDNPDALRRMIKAVDEANIIINANPESAEIVEIAHKYTGAPKDAIIHGNHRLKFTTQIDEEGLCKLGDELVEMGILRECPADMFAPEFRGITWN